MADEKKTADEAEVTKEKAEKKAAKTKKTDKKKFSFKAIGQAIARFFKDQKGEIKKIIWPTRKMVIKSTGVVIASILVIGIGIWILDFALASGITAVENAANKTETTTEAVSEDIADGISIETDDAEKGEDETEAETEAAAESTEATSAEAAE